MEKKSCCFCFFIYRNKDSLLSKRRLNISPEASSNWTVQSTPRGVFRTHLYYVSMKAKRPNKTPLILHTNDNKHNITQSHVSLVAKNASVRTSRRYPKPISINKFTNISKLTQLYDIAKKADLDTCNSWSIWVGVDCPVITGE